MTKKVALVTGANKGIGYETARTLAREGVHVLLGSRDRVRGEKAASELAKEGSVEHITLDVTDEESIEATRDYIAKKFGRLDILVNNAGILVDQLDRAPSQQPLAAWRKTFDTNVFGLVAVTNALLPLIREAGAGRIVNVSSLLGSIAEHRDPSSQVYEMKVPAYNVSKSAVNDWTVQLAHELRNTQVKVNAVHPGHVATDMAGPDAPLTPAEGARTSVRLALLGADGPSGGFYHEQEALRW
jgi:NAD(P)-dependent dehydrogenase (short-subunit alcohol dehydrogenase family)